MLLVAEPKTFGEKLRELREKAGMSQADLAYQAGIHRTDVSRYERNVFGPTLAVAQRLAKALGVNVAVFPEPVDADDPRGGPSE